MKTTTLLPAALLAAIVSGSAAVAQENATVAPSPAPAVQAPQQAAPAPIKVSGYVYVAKLPTPTQLLKDAEAEGLTIGRMEQGADRLLVVYQYPNGSTRAFVYTTSTAAVAATAPLTSQLSTATYSVVSAPPGTVVYTTPAPDVYYSPSYVRYYDPAWDFWAPLAIGVGLGWGFGGHGGWHGGWHGHGGWHH